MARKRPRPPATMHISLVPLQNTCWHCGGTLWMAYCSVRTITTLEGMCQLHLTIRRCHNRACERYHHPYRPEEEGRWALPHGEFGLDIIALVGMLRYEAHHSIPEIHQELCKRGVDIAERTVTHLLARYEELVALHRCRPCSFGGASHLPRIYHSRVLSAYNPMLDMKSCGSCVIASEVWFFWLGVSGVASQKDLAGLLNEVQQAIAVPVRGIISDGQHSIRNAVHAVFPDVPHQLCHFHYFREAAKPAYEADRHAKKELKKQLRGVRPIERSVEQRNDAEAEIIHDYCLAVRSVLTDDGHPPLEAPGLKLYERISAIVASLTRVSEQRSLPHALEQMLLMLNKGLVKTAQLWSDVQQGYAWVHQAAHILSNEKQQCAAQVRQTYEQFLTEMAQAPASSETLTLMTSVFRKVTTSYWSGLFHCYDIPDLPRTNNNLSNNLVQHAIMSGGRREEKSHHQE